MAQGIQEQIGILPAVEAKCHFVQVRCEMLCTDFVPASYDSALEKRERGFDSVSVNVSSEPDVFLFRVIDALVLDLANGGFVGLPFIGNQHVHIGADIFLNVLSKCAGLRICGVEESEFPVALPYPNHSFFPAHHSGFLPGLTDVAKFSADIGFVHFDGAIQHWLFGFFHGRTDSMAEIPRGLVADSESALDLISRHSLARFAKQQCGEKPFLQGQMRIVEDRVCSYSELIIAGLAVEQLLGRGEFHDRAMTPETLDASGPAQAHKQLAAARIGIKQIDYVN